MYIRITITLKKYIFNCRPLLKIRIQPILKLWIRIREQRKADPNQRPRAWGCNKIRIRNTGKRRIPLAGQIWLNNRYDCLNYMNNTVQYYAYSNFHCPQFTAAAAQFEVQSNNSTFGISLITGKVYQTSISNSIFKSLMFKSVHKKKIKKN